MHESFLPVEGLTADQILTIPQQLYLLLAQQTQKYTSGESSSIPEELAAELLDSICYCLEQHEAGLHVLLHQDGMEALTEGIRRVGRKQIRSSIAWQQVCNHLPPVENRSMLDTLKSIGLFWQRYDPRFFAREIPCDIDYQLAHPVPDELLGVAWLRDYLDRLLIEDTVLRRFPSDSVRRVLAASCPDHQELLVNLYEPAAAAALGVTMAEGDLFELDITAAGQVTLTAWLAPMSVCARRLALERAGETLARRLELPAGAAAYLRETALALAPRVEAVLASGGGWQTIFPAFS